MKAQEIKDLLFPGFSKWLNEASITKDGEKIGDHFDMTIWMGKAFDYFFEQYVKSNEQISQLTKVLGMLPTGELEEELKKRKLIEEKQKEAQEKTKKENADAKNDIEKTREEIIKEKKEKKDKKDDNVIVMNEEKGKKEEDKENA